MKSLNLSYDDKDFEKMKANKKHSKMKWERFMFEAVMQYSKPDKIFELKNEMQK